jgi:outer membrane protein assembly factor BamD
MKNYISTLALFLLFHAMNIKSIEKDDDVIVKFEMVLNYEAGKYKSNKTFEQMHLHRGKPQAEKLFYMFSQSYKTKNNII